MDYINFGGTASIKKTEYVERLFFKETICFFYCNCIDRVNNARIKKGLKYYEVCSDASLVSDFFRGNCTKDNPYLITGNLIGIPRKAVKGQEKNRTKTGILHTLGFNNSIKEILWGTDEEIANSLYMLYMLIMEELPQYCSEYYEDWENVLFDYVPYSKYKTLYDLKGNLYISLTNIYGVYDEDISPQKIAIHQINAITFFFRNQSFKNDFKAALIKFANEHKSFTRIDEKFKKSFIIKSFIPLLQKYKPTHENSLGSRVRDLLNNDLRSVPELLSSEYSEKTQDKIKRMKNLATSKYINELEKIHEMEFGYLFG